MLLKPMTDGRVSGTGTIACESRIFGGILLSTDGTNAATISVQKDNSNGDPVFEFYSVTAQMVVAPIQASDTLYYSISGTNVTAQLFEWVR